MSTHQDVTGSFRLPFQAVFDLAHRHKSLLLQTGKETKRCRVKRFKNKSLNYSFLSRASRLNMAAYTGNFKAKNWAENALLKNTPRIEKKIK